VPLDNDETPPAMPFEWNSEKENDTGDADIVGKRNGLETS
jgi:hypothetical protein